MTETEPTWAKYWDELWELLTPLYAAGWAMPEEDTTSSEEDPDKHWTLHQRLMRSCLVFQVTYEQHGRRLTFGPGADKTVADEDGIGEYDMFPEPVTIQLGGKAKADRMTEVWDAARRLGLLDSTRAQLPKHDFVGWQQFIGDIHRKYVLADISAYRKTTLRQAAKLAISDADCQEVFGWVDYAGKRVLPDPVPTAAALGIAYWGWRHTVVEDWHAKLPDQVNNDVMAKCNIQSTKIALAHITVEHGVDWPAVITALTDPDRQLPGGWKLAVIFREGWQPIRAAVAERLAPFKRAQDVLGPPAMLRLLSILGSSSYTKRWWGNGWWPDLCEQVIARFTETGTPLPKPYDRRGADALRADLTDHPELLPDAVLKACRIGASPKGTEGLGFLSMDEPLHRHVFPRDAE
jgi:hypothetical protein